MAWLKGFIETSSRNGQYTEYCINIDDIRNFTKDASIYKEYGRPVCRAWFKSINSYQDISVEDYEKIRLYLEDVAKSPDKQLPSDAMLM